MNFVFRHRLLAAFAAAAAGLVAGAVTVAPAGCASDCGSNCPPATVVLESPINVDPGVLGLSWEGPACPPVAPSCRGDDFNTFCRRIDVVAFAQGYCDLRIALYGRDPMVIHLEFGPPSGIGCCKGYPVIGDWYYTIPLDFDAGIYSGDGNMDRVTVERDAGTNTGDTGTD